MTTFFDKRRRMIMAAALSLSMSGPVGAQEGEPMPAASPLPVNLSAPSLNPLAQIPTAQMASFLNRPLFTASRRPYLAPPAEAVAPPPPPPAPSATHIRLVGTVRMPTGSSALIEDTTRGIMHTVSEGGTVDGWRVSDIRPSAVRIEQNGRTIDLGMFKPGQQVAPAPSAAQQGSAGGASSVQGVPSPAPEAPASPPPIATRQSAPGVAPPGTVAGTAAAAAAANSPYKLTFGSSAPAGKP